MKKEEGRRKKEKGKRKKWMGTVNDLPLSVYKPQQSCKHRVDGGVLNPKEKDKISTNIRKHSAVSYQVSAIAFCEW
ncbi:MAG: hypothetical protein SWX82_22530 [Cyanobacteriota bacterium]|nr:hypothetical protein [Cyanobacteriota bacterium]